MLYIDNLDYGVRFGNATGGGTHVKVHPNTLAARADETGRIWIQNHELKEYVLNCCPVDEITLDGVVHASAENFVTVFNGAVAGVTVTTTLAP